MTDVRSDVERAFTKKKPQPDIDIAEVIKGGAALGGGILVGRYLGKAILRQIAKRNLAKTGMREFQRGRDVYNMVPPDSSSRFRKGKQ